MYKTKFKFLIAIGVTLLFATCTKLETISVNTNIFGTAVDLSGSTLSADQLTSVVYFSTDNGATFVQYPVLQNGQKFMARVFDTKLKGGAGLFLRNTISTKADSLTGMPFFTMDWSGSVPAPTSGGTTDTPEFTFNGANSITTKVTNTYCAFNPSSWTGVWGGDEVGACCGGTDKNNITQDSSNPNKFWMDNFWGDHVPAYIIFTPSTNFHDQVVTLPKQTTADPGVASGTGTYDQCSQTFTINTTYVAFGGTYVWQYNFHR